LLNVMDLNELLDVARTADEPRPVDRSKVGMGGVDPLGLRQINFGLMDRVLPDLNNVASHIRPYTLMAWAWRRVRHILERGRRQSAQPEEMRDFVDRIEAIYAWSQFLIDPKADIPGAQAMRPMLDAVRYRFGGEEWEARRNMRRYSTGFISPLNYGPSLRTMGWLIPVEGAAGIFQPDPALEPVLALCLREAPSQGHPFENPDRLPLSRAKREAESWRELSPAGFVGRVLEIWIMAQHAYWSVGRGLADARNRGKTILRLRIVMDEGGWTLTPGTTRQGNPPEPTPDRLETATNLLVECGRL
jgi:hypothetical protein